MIPELNSLVENELRPSEKLIWSGQPDADKFVGSILPFSLVWMSGLFLFCVGVLRQSQGQEANVLPTLIGLLILVAFIGALEIIFVPLRARQTVYAVTDQRMFVLTIRSRFVANDPHHTHLSGKQLIRTNKSTARKFYLSNLPPQLIFIFLAIDVMISLTRRFELFIMLGFVFVVIGWFMQWYQDLRLPAPKYREPERNLYNVTDLLISVESIDYPKLNKLIVRKGRNNRGDIFAISNDDGCLRFRYVHELAEMQKALSANAPKV